MPETLALSVRQETSYVTHIMFHLKKINDSFLVLRTSGRLSKQVVLIFITRLSTDFSSPRVGIFFYAADQLGRTSEPSHENGLKLKRGYHTATTRNSGQT